MDSTATALRLERRRAFLAEQETPSRELGRRALVFVQEPTVVAFHPAQWPALDNTGWHERVARYRSAAAAAGWAYTERYSDHLRLFNQFQGGSYPVRVSPEAAGVLLVAPGASPRVMYCDLSA